MSYTNVFTKAPILTSHGLSNPWAKPPTNYLQQALIAEKAAKELETRRNKAKAELDERNRLAREAEAQNDSLLTDKDKATLKTYVY